MRRNQYTKWYTEEENLYTGSTFVEISPIREIPTPSREPMVILFDQYNLPEDIYEIVFATEQQVVVARMLVDEMKRHGGEMGKTEMSLFATALHDGTTIAGKASTSQFGPKPKDVKISYNKRQFYDRILTPMKTMGIIDYDLYKKTYRISDKFSRNMMKIGLMWSQERT